MVGELTFRASVPRTVSAAWDARHDLNSWLPDRCGPSAAEAALLLASELVTNAVVHTRSADIGVRARCDGETLAVSVEDEVAPGPTCCAVSPTGSGLSLVDSLAERWGCEPLPTGKRVWFEVPCARRDDAAATGRGGSPGSAR